MPSNVRELREDIQQFEKDLDRFDRRLDNTRLMLIQSMLLLRRMNLPPDIERAISSLIRARIVAEQWVRGIQMMQAAYLMGGPMSWAFAALTLGIATLTMTDLAMDVGGH